MWLDCVAKRCPAWTPLCRKLRWFYTKAARKVVGLEPRSPLAWFSFFTLGDVAICGLDASRLLFTHLGALKAFFHSQVRGTLDFKKSVWDRNSTELPRNSEAWVLLRIQLCHWLAGNSEVNWGFPGHSPVWDLLHLFQRWYPLGRRQTASLRDLI